MKLLLFTTRFQPAWDWGGPVRSSWGLARGLAARGAQVTVVTTDATQTGRVPVPPMRLEEGVRILTAQVLGRGRVRAANRFALAPGLATRLCAQVPEADLVHIEGLWSAAHPLCFALCRFHKKPYIVCPRGNLEGYSLQQKSRKKDLVLRLMLRAPIERSSAVLFTTDQERETAPPWLRALPHLVVPNPVDIRHDGNRDRFRASLDMAPDELLLGMIGRIHPKKGFDLLIPALAEARPGRNLRLVIVGPDEGGTLATVQALVARHGLGSRVVFLPRLEGQALCDAYAGLDLLVLPSREENFGNVVVEALGQGTPVCISEAVGLRRFVTETGLGLVLPLEPGAWHDLLSGEALGRLLIGWDRQAARDQARRAFSVETVSKTLYDHYARLAK